MTTAIPVRPATRPIVAAFCILTALLLFSTGCRQAAPPEENPVVRGRYLVTLMGCNDCHSPKIMHPEMGPIPDTTRLLSGNPQGAPHPTWTPEDMTTRNTAAATNMHFTSWSGPWGTSFAMNLTPDKETGLGEWTEEAFLQAIRTGKHQGQPNGRAILPPMPWPMFREATDADLKAVWAYLRSIPAVRNEIALPIPPAPADSSAK